MEQRIEDRHNSFRPLQGETLLADVTFVQKNLECLRFEQGTKERDLYFGRRRRSENTRLKPVPYPVANTGVLDVLKFGANRAGVNLIEKRDHLPQRHLAIVEKEFR